MSCVAFDSPVVPESASARGDRLVRPRPQMPGWLSRHGIESVERCADGTAVIELRRFHASPAARAALVAAIARLSAAESIVIDLRRHRGGDAAMAALLTSVLFDTEPLYADEVWIGGAPLPVALPEPRCARQHVEIWVSRSTSSVALEFAANLARLGRATVRVIPAARP